MTSYDDLLGGHSGLPDPATDSQFYDGVPARRLLAFLIDAALVWGAAIVIGVLTLGLGFIFLGLIVGVLDFAHRVLAIADRSATIGMRIVGVELRGRGGERLGFGEALVHTLLFYLSVSIVVVQLVSVIMMAGSTLGRGLHDLPLGSTMINSPA